MTLITTRYYANGKVCEYRGKESFKKQSLYNGSQFLGSTYYQKTDNDWKEISYNQFRSLTDKNEPVW